MKRLTIIFLLLVSSASAQIPGSRDSLSYRVFTRHKLPIAGGAATTTAVVYQCLNDATTPVCQDFDAFEKFDTILVSRATEGTTLPADFLRIAAVYRMVGDTGRIPMQEIKQAEIWEKTGGKTGATYSSQIGDLSFPRYFYTYGNRLFTYPKDMKPSNRSDSLFVAYWAIGHNLDGATDSTDVYPEFREALVLKACANVARFREGPSSATAAGFETLYTNEVLKYGRVKK